jgi:hypothetical protein
MAPFVLAWVVTARLGCSGIYSGPVLGQRTPLRNAQKATRPRTACSEQHSYEHDAREQAPRHHAFRGVGPR